jgi:hypothetical protein
MDGDGITEEIMIDKRQIEETIERMWATTLETTQTTTLETTQTITIEITQATIQEKITHKKQIEEILLTREKILRETIVGGKTGTKGGVTEDMTGEDMIEEVTIEVVTTEGVMIGVARGEGMIEKDPKVGMREETKGEKEMIEITEETIGGDQIEEGMIDATEATTDPNMVR